MTPPPPRSTPFPYTTLFRSRAPTHVPHEPLLISGITDIVVRLADGARLSGFEELKALHQHRSEEHTSELQSQFHLVCRLLLERKKPDSVTPPAPPEFPRPLP